MTGTIDLAALRALDEAADHGDWKVYEIQLTPKYGEVDLPPSALIELRIGTADHHPQLKAPLPIVTTSNRFRTAEQYGVHITRENAELIVAMRNALPALLDRLERAEKVVGAANRLVHVMENHDAEIFGPPDAVLAYRKVRTEVDAARGGTNA